jgi:hypothetical protein
MTNPTRNVSLAITATSSEVAADMERIGGRTNIVLRNNSPNAADIITVSLGRPAAVAGVGIIIKQGEVWFDSNDGTGYLAWQNEIQAVCATANGVLVVAER